MRTAPSNSDDVIDSRDVIERIEELEGERGEYQERDRTEPLTESWGQTNEDDATELAALLELQEEAESYSDDWRHGSTLIRDSYFETYAQELADDLGLIQRGATWPNDCIDWAKAARELQQDYTSVSFDGVEYWVR